jgi:hypothetical protein
VRKQGRGRRGGRKGGREGRTSKNLEMEHCLVLKNTQLRGSKLTVALPPEFENELSEERREGCRGEDLVRTSGGGRARERASHVFFPPSSFLTCRCSHNTP